MERAAARLAELDAALADPATFSGDPRRAAELGKARSEAQAALDAAESAWLEAVEALEALRA
jgi:ATP-binding cassette subfamily F protein 3